MSDFREVPVADEVQDEIDHFAKLAIELLGLPDAEGTPRAVASAINDYLVAGTVRSAASVELDDVAVALGCLWGEQIRRGLSWEWVRFHTGVDTQADDVDEDYLLGVAPDDRRFVIFPIDYIGSLLEDGRDSTALLLYNMLEAGDVPSSEPGTYFELG